MDPSDARWQAVAGIFDRANFISHLGMKLVDVGDGSCSVELLTDERHLQQHGFVHAGVLATLADHAAGGAARSTVPDESDVITIEFKINFLKPAPAGRLLGNARVLRAGKTVIVAETEVSKLTSTLAVIPAKE
jgi:uncharacterized protein (TIGR00369 family)